MSQAGGATEPPSDAENAWAPSTDHGRPHHVVDTVITRGIDPEGFDRFFNAMAMDLTRTSYQIWEDLRDYV